MQRVPTSHSSYINFQVNPINRFQDIDVVSWPKKTTKKAKIFDHGDPLFNYYFVKEKCHLGGIIPLPHNDITTQIQTLVLEYQ